VPVILVPSRRCSEQKTEWWKGRTVYPLHRSQCGHPQTPASGRSPYCSYVPTRTRHVTPILRASIAARYTFEKNSQRQRSPCYDEGEPMKANSASILTRAASTEDRAGLTMRIT
jgi:hypothetical protein